MSYGRRYRRILLRDYLQVSESSSEEALGYLSNITVNGAQVVTQSLWDTHKPYSLKIALPRELDFDDFLTVKASVVWAQPDVTPQFYDIGIRFSSLSGKHKKVIFKLIAFFGLDDGWGVGQCGGL